MKMFKECSLFEQKRILAWMKADGWSITCVYQPENEDGTSKDGIGVMLKDLIIDE